jgi:hypothetical protein
MQDCYDAPLTFSRGQYDTMMLALLRCVYTGRNDSQVLMSMEQALPVHHSWLNFNRYQQLLRRIHVLQVCSLVKVCGHETSGVIHATINNLHARVLPLADVLLGGLRAVSGTVPGISFWCRHVKCMVPSTADPTVLITGFQHFKIQLQHRFCPFFGANSVDMPCNPFR